MSVLDSLALTRIPAEDEALRAEVRAFLAQAISGLPPHVRARSWGGYSAELSRQLGEKGWIGVTLPREYGGGGRSAFTRYVLVEEYLACGAPVGSHWIADRQSGPLILKYGTEAQKRFYLPRICRGEAFFCIGMSEPGAGSDLASVKTRAVPNDKGFVLNGQKIWTTNAHHCHYMIALVRTSGEAGDRHKGLSQVIVDLSLPGVTVRPITDLSGDSHFCEVFFDNVQLPPDALIGQEGQGWEQVTAELAFERSGPERLFSSIVLFDEWLAWLRATGERSEGALRLAGRVFTELAPLRAMSVAVQDKLVRGESPIVEAALVKELGTTLEQSIPAAIADDLFAREASEVPLELLRTLNYVTEVAPSYSLRGGTRDILRGMIARGLGLR
ncbi:MULTISPECIES: acyl-CoA dehydrogenase family protein [Delftia]|jgi:alkylation response protein AidB-like acyl-CoA dehydrogenase|uniref:acyl-CoA dehydrogenase family protein n=1 Tax=Delftia TaxID=80865 RepID=UPI000C1A0E03|nr:MULTISPECIES: acyl-CoA dehydrogenase family protein [Delftia]PIF35361.1 alkylation response protein AidB-like acyl-CoA dehydrogenase [Burkholderiales bacterium 23]MBK0110862.1 acyl-CoA dehydrogenase family protein [Delftia sp. S65]MBK0116388.1 acyl-CoA dehydrogenase family protein [Delftia sp. S67]MBK0128679.1 acyl-CoA dehydrogenase family protein [Delftia sp. S66]PIF63858.1 alkylation response protein AidB-like acyl-CoA dehydrogenase [Delftia sp. 60]